MKDILTYGTEIMRSSTFLFKIFVNGSRRIREGGPFFQHRCKDQVNCVANGWRVPVASETVLATWSHFTARRLRAQQSEDFCSIYVVMQKSCCLKLDDDNSYHATPLVLVRTSWTNMSIRVGSPARGTANHDSCCKHLIPFSLISVALS